MAKKISIANAETGRSKTVWDVTYHDLRQLVQAAYDLSVPQGRGHLQYQPVTLTQEEIDDIIARTQSVEHHVVMDYVKGRAVKLTVFKPGEEDINPPEMTAFIRNEWHDHTEGDMEELLRRSETAPAG